jgi:hypothetical protein
LSQAPKYIWPAFEPKYIPPKSQAKQRQKFDPNENKGEKNVMGISWIDTCAKHFIDVHRSAERPPISSDESIRRIED